MNKIGFVTCVELGQACLKSLVDEDLRIDLAITLPDHVAQNKSGRIYLDEYCKNQNINLIKSDNINNSAVLRAVKEHSIDWLFVIGWSQIIKEELLRTPRLGVVGIHPTLLPEGRGRAAIPWAIIKGLKKTGVTMFKIDEGVDTGPILDQIEIPLSSNTTASELYKVVNEAHVSLIKNNAARLMQGELNATIQDESIATEWPGRRPVDGDLLTCNSVAQAERLVRATTHPYPGAFYERGNERTVIWSAEVLPENSIAPSNSLKFFDGILVPKEFSTQAL